MSFKDVAPETAEVTIGNSVISLAPLSLSDISLLMERHGSALAQAIVLYGPVLGDPAYAEAFSAYLLTQSPPLACAAIAISAGEPENVDIVARLPAGFQLHAFATVVRLTMAGHNPADVLERLSAAVVPLLALDLRSMRQ
jgi:hypothetical protein